MKWDEPHINNTWMRRAPSVARCPALAAENHRVKLWTKQVFFSPPTADRHLNSSYWVQHLVIHNLTGLPNRGHSCSCFDKRSHLTSRRCEQLVALYCQDEKAEAGPVSRVGLWCGGSTTSTQQHTPVKSKVTGRWDGSGDIWHALTWQREHPTT